MRVLAVTTWLPTGAAPTRGSFVVNNLRAISTNHDVRVVHLVSPGDDDGQRRLHPAELAGIPVIRIPMSTSSPRDIAAASVELARIVRSKTWQPQLLHSMAISSLEPLVMLRATGHITIPWVHTEHWSALTAPQTLPRLAQPLLPALRAMLRYPDVVTTDSHFLAQGVTCGPAGRGQARDTRVIPCIVEPYEPAARRDRGDGATKLVSVGGLIERKDPLLAVDIVAELVNRGLDAHLTWVGSGPLTQQVHDHAEGLGIAERITLAGARSPQGVRQALQDADLFLAPTRSDNFFVAVAEAIIAGRPVVTSATGGQGEYLDPAYSRLVCDRDPAQWAQAVIELDAATRHTPAHEIAASIGDRFSAAKAAQRYSDAYAAACTPGGKLW